MIDVDKYIRDEIDYIETYDEYGKEDLPFLKSLNEEDIKKIQEQVNNDDELHQYINETINWYVYHYKKGDE